MVYPFGTLTSTARDQPVLSFARGQLSPHDVRQLVATPICDTSIHLGRRDGRLYGSTMVLVDYESILI